MYITLSKHEYKYINQMIEKFLIYYYYYYYILIQIDWRKGQKPQFDSVVNNNGRSLE